MQENDFRMFGTNCGKIGERKIGSFLFLIVQIDVCLEDAL